MDGPFRSMTPDQDSHKRDAMFDWPRAKCERCHGWVYAGDWPFCRGSVVDHKR